MFKRICITGSKGFIGKKIVSQLSQNNFHIIELDLEDGIDISNWEQVKQVENFDVLIHLAGLSFVPDSYKDPRLMYTTNIISTLNMLELCKINNAKMIYTSSYVYGKPDYLPIDEIHPLRSFNPYSQSKIIGEELCHSYNSSFGVPIIIFRPFNVYGPNQNKNFLIPLILSQIENEGRINLKDPVPKRDFVHLNDICNAFYKAIFYNKSSFEIFNIGSGKSYSVDEIAKAITTLFANNIEISYTNETRENEVLDTVADISKAKQLLNWYPQVSLFDGLKDIATQNIIF
jgi:nucleoside-diphosphate-sugar epimerase